MSNTDGFLGYLCGQTGRIATIHGLVWLVLGLNTVSYLFVETGPGTDVIIGINFIGMIPALLVSGAILLYCRSQE